MMQSNGFKNYMLPMSAGAAAGGLMYSTSVVPNGRYMRYAPMAYPVLGMAAGYGYQRMGDKIGGVENGLKSMGDKIGGVENGLKRVEETNEELRESLKVLHDLKNNVNLLLRWTESNIDKPEEFDPDEVDWVKYRELKEQIVKAVEKLN